MRNIERRPLAAFFVAGGRGRGAALPQAEMSRQGRIWCSISASHGRLNQEAKAGTMLRWIAVGLTSLTLVYGAGAIAAERQVPDNSAAVQLSFAPVVKKVAPAVVNVYASRVVEQQASPFFADPFFRRFFGDLGGGQPSQRVQRSLGSGVIIDPSGLIVTNFHVIEHADQVKVALSDKREFPADIVLKDPRSDLAVLKISGAGPNLPTLTFADSDQGRGRRPGAGHRRPLRRRPDRHQRHRLGLRPCSRRPVAGPVFHPDRRRHQSGQFRRCAGRHERPAGRHQSHDRHAVGRLHRHRLRHPVQSGARRGRCRGHRPGAETAVAGRHPAERDARDRRCHGAEDAGRRAGRRCRTQADRRRRRT